MPQRRLFHSCVSCWPNLLFIFIVQSALPSIAQDPIRRTLDYAPAPVANPLKGLVPYAGNWDDRFPHSMEFSYLPLSALVKGEKDYDWTELEELLDDVASRGHQTIFRIFLEYPGKTGAIPDYLVQSGLKIHKYLNTNTQPFPPQEIETPDYSDSNLRRCLVDFISTLGHEYDGDPRIAFITAGLLGTWGEWHTYPRSELWASKEVQREVLEAYEKAFTTTKILLRYPAAPGNSVYVSTVGRPFGYHDDSFAWATLDTGREEDSWFFMAVMKKGGHELLESWKRYPIGGEIRPEAWGIVFDSQINNEQVQDFAECVEATHASWLMDSGMFSLKAEEPRLSRALAQVQRMGYELTIRSATCWREEMSVRVQAEVLNLGVAPFYYQWPIEFAIIDSEGQVIQSSAGKGSLTDLLPDSEPQIWSSIVNMKTVNPGSYQVAVRISNPLSGGIPLRFANRDQDRHRQGWLSLLPLDWK